MLKKLTERVLESLATHAKSQEEFVQQTGRGKVELSSYQIDNLAGYRVDAHYKSPFGKRVHLSYQAFSNEDVQDFERQLKNNGAKVYSDVEPDYLFI